MKPEVLHIAPMVPGVEAALDAAYRVHRYFAAADRTALLAEAGARIRAVATDGHYGIAPEILAALPALELVASYGVGYDAIDTAACRARGVRVTNTPDVLNDAVAELLKNRRFTVEQREVALKGVGQPTAVYRVTQPPPG